jgi:polysaccharide pyruvyl transferase WcaK-like protein
VLPTGKYSDAEKFEIADTLLRKYAKAKLVVTSRIHCALPCLAMGTPVIFINGFDSLIDTCRFDGIMNLFNRVDVDSKGNFKANFELKGKIDTHTKVTNLSEHKILAENLKEKCKLFCEQTDY